MKDYIKKLKKVKNYPVLVLFFSFIFIITIFDLIVNDKEFSEMENKFLEMKPKFQFNEFVDNEFVPKYEKYINEQFVFRNKWIDLKSRTEIYLGKTENNGIVYGKDNYLLDKVQTINNKQLNKNMSSIKKFIELNSNENIKFALIPNSFEVYKDKLPFGLTLFDQNNLINDVNNLYGSYDNVSTINLLEIMNEHKDEYIYYRTDHHWTTLGAYYAYEELMNSLNKNHVNINDLNSHNVDFFLGTYYSKSKKYNSKFDSITYYDANVQKMTIGNKENNKYKEYTDIYEYSKFEERDKYAAFLYGNNDITVITSKDAVDKPENERSRILIIKDSFGNSFVPYLTYSYDEVYVLDLRSNTLKMSEIMKNYSFDDILILYSVNNFIDDVNIIRITY